MTSGGRAETQKNVSSLRPLIKKTQTNSSRSTSKKPSRDVPGKSIQSEKGKRSKTAATGGRRVGKALPDSEGANRDGGGTYKRADGKVSLRRNV